MYKDYEKCSDEELIMRQRDGEEAVTDYIMDKYKNLVRNKAKSMYTVSYTHLTLPTNSRV